MLMFFQIFQKLHFDISFADSLLHIPKFASTFKSLLSNKEKLIDLASTPLNKNCSAVLHKKLPEKLGDPGRFLIPCDFLELDECLALADLGASINLMPLSVWKKLSLPELTPTRMNLKLANRSFAYPKDYDVDPWVPLILGRPFLRTARALVDVYGEELILRDGDEQLIFHTDTTSKYHIIESIKMINFIDIPCEDNFEEVLKIKTLSHHLSGSTISTPDSSPSLTPIETSDSLFEEFADELALLEPFPQGIGDANFYLEGDILLLEKLLNHDLKELNFEELKMIKSLIDDLPLLTFWRELEDIESNEFYVSNLDEPVLSVTPLSDVNEDECFDPGGDIDEINAFLDMNVSTYIEDGYYDSEGDIIYLESFLIDDTSPNLPPEVFSDHDPKNLKDELDNNDLKSMVKVSDPGISAYSFYSLEPMAYESPMEDCSSTCFVPNITMIWREIAPDFENSGACGFVHPPLELLSLACLYMGI
ncbi:reverse transcriptase domain-containing protein [Tanacetum coccineum]